MVTDSQLYNDATNKLAFEPEVDSINIAISVHDGIATLGGVVSKFSEKLAAERAVKNVKGIKGVVNEINVESLPQYRWTDLGIAKAAVNALEWHVSVPNGSIKVVVEDGWITLSGDVKWNLQKQAAESCVRNLHGIKGIFNKIEIKPSVTPVDVKNKILEEFDRNSIVDAEAIDVETTGSTVILKGKVRNWDELEEAESAAWAVSGVSRVDNRLTIGWDV